MCFSTIATLIADAALAGVNLAINPAASKTAGEFDVIVTFKQKPVGNESALWSAPANSNIDRALMLRSAMNTPVVVRCVPEGLAVAIATALEQLQQPLTDAATAYAALNVSQLLSAAAKKPKTKGNTEAVDEAQDQDAETGAEPDSPEAAPVAAADIDYSTIDSL